MISYSCVSRALTIVLFCIACTFIQYKEVWGHKNVFFFAPSNTIQTLYGNLCWPWNLLINKEWSLVLRSIETCMSFAIIWYLIEHNPVYSSLAISCWRVLILLTMEQTKVRPFTASCLNNRTFELHFTSWILATFWWSQKLHLHLVSYTTYIEAWTCNQA